MLSFGKRNELKPLSQVVVGYLTSPKVILDRDVSGFRYLHKVLWILDNPMGCLFSISAK